MAGAVSLLSVVGLLLVSALPGVLGDHANPDLRVHPGTSEGCWKRAGTVHGSQAPAQLTRLCPPSAGNAAHLGSGATGPRRPPLKDQRERARAGSLPLGALYTAAVVAFVLYKCLQGKNETTVLHEEAGKQQPLQSEQQLAQLTQQLAQTEQHLNNLMAQLDPLFERVTTLAGAQQELLNMKLQTIHELLQESKPDKEASRPLHEDFCLKEDEEEAGDSQAWEEPINWSTETWNLATSREVEQGLRRRCSQAMTKDPSHSPGREGGTTAEG
uniref:Coiled-coil domain containing 107 n=1 Tax=Aotus nancymaae TaxID=37293 RepID=A0A2K5CW14_AOTNA